MWKKAVTVVVTVPTAMVIAALLSNATAHADESGDLRGQIFDYHTYDEAELGVNNSK